MYLLCTLYYMGWQCHIKFGYTEVQLYCETADSYCLIFELELTWIVLVSIDSGHSGQLRNIKV